MVVLLLISLLISSRSIFYVFGCSCFGYVYIYQDYILFLYLSLQYYEVAFFIFVMVFNLKSILLDIVFLPQLFFHFNLPENYFSIPSLLVSVSATYWVTSKVSPNSRRLKSYHTSSEVCRLLWHLDPT
ncbi:unnamed protein product [Pipistrellus nathusii]|uniref:NADH dehydrogenase subunit 4 n=1 Tax=Pipistrellus nathusii TaxID=59473 RepID=A0ABN9ZSU6_PIPNA